MQLAGAHVLVTGASRGIGACLAEQAAGRAQQLSGRVLDGLLNCAGVDALGGLLEVDAASLLGVPRR